MNVGTRNSTPRRLREDLRTTRGDTERTAATLVWVRLFFVDGPERSKGALRAAWQELFDPSKTG